MISKKYSIMDHFFYPTVILVTVLMLIVFASARGMSSREYLMGGETTGHSIDHQIGDNNTQASSANTSDLAKILRPSNQPIIAPRFDFKSGGTGLPKTFNNPRDLIEAYFSILSKAENMEGCCSGCGATGWAQEPYPIAYEMLSQEMKKTMSFQKFLDSFRGIGHMNLLKLHEMNQAIVSGKSYQRFFVEFESIEKSQNRNLTLFGYYTGELILQNEGEKGWKIRQIGVRGEDFLCKAYHGKYPDAQTVAEVSYQISSIFNIKQEGSIIELLGQSKSGRIYKLIFTRLTNGSDYLIRSFVQNDKGKWEESYMN